MMVPSETRRNDKNMTTFK